MRLLPFCCLLGLCYFEVSSLTAQYDFPVVVHGLSVRLDLRSSQVLHAQQFLWNDSEGCDPGGEVLIARSGFTIPKDTIPPPEAAPSIQFGCDDFSTESVDVWYQDTYGQWLVTETYVILVGLENCPGICEDTCAAAAPLLYNGLAVSIAGEDSLEISAKAFLAETAAPGITYSFSDRPADSILRLGCNAPPVQPILIYGFGDTLQTLPNSTYLALYTGAECSFSEGPSAQAIQGLSIPNTPSGVVTVPARAFQPVNVPVQSLSFSTDPTDTLFTIDCDSIGIGGINLSIYNTVDGITGPPTSSYLIGDDGQGWCSSEIMPKNDSPAAALTLTVDNCERFFQFARATPDSLYFPQEGTSPGSTWYRFPNGEPGTFPRVTIRTLDSVSAEWFYGDERLPIRAFSESPIPVQAGETYTFGACDALRDTMVSPSDTYLYLRVSQAVAQRPVRFWVRADSDVCTGTNSPTPATFTVYPNPARNVVYFESTESFFGGEISYALFATDGRLLKKKALPSAARRQRIDLSGFPPGTYFLRITSGGRQAVTKVLLRP